MIAYLSKIRLSLASVKDELHSNLLSQEGLNLEYMLRDLLMLRRDKILAAALELRRPQGIMTLPEEEFYNRLLRGFKGHQEFVSESMSGAAVSSLKSETDDSSGRSKTDDDALDYVTVRFLKPTDIPAEGLDGRTYGPYAREDIARMPVSTALVWINQKVAVRVMTEELNTGV
jgi:DNA replication initiation complex subunit (GINS family)